MTKKSLREYGVTRGEIVSFTESVMEKQGRLMVNNYTELSKENVLTNLSAIILKKLS